MSRRAILTRGLVGLALILGGVGVNVQGAEASTRSTSLGGASVVRWNPCDTISWRADVRHAPGPNARALRVIKQQVRATARLTGLRYRYEGLVRPGSRQDLTVEWASWRGTLVGWGEARWDGDGQIYRGRVLLNRATLRGDQAHLTRHVIVHEILHTAGAGHSSSRADIMHPRAHRQVTPGAGDRETIRRVGSRAGCFEESAS